MKMTTKTKKTPKTADKAKTHKVGAAKKAIGAKKSGAEGKDTKEKAKVGRPTDYKPEYAEQTYKLCLMGMTDAELGSFFGVSEVTINAWKNEHPEFLKSMRAGKEMADAEVSVSLYQRALGYSHPEVHISNYQGMITETPLTKHYPPDTAAASLWLRNRQSGKWRDKVDVDHGIQPDNPLADLMGKIVGSDTGRIRPAS